MTPYNCHDLSLTITLPRVQLWCLNVVQRNRANAYLAIVCVIAKEQNSKNMLGQKYKFISQNPKLTNCWRNLPKNMKMMVSEMEAISFRPYLIVVCDLLDMLASTYFFIVNPQKVQLQNKETFIVFYMKQNTNRWKIGF